MTDVLNDDAKRTIPAGVKRHVRQRDGFGCIFCGSPVFDYDHLVDFAEVKAHDPDNIHLLCPIHHRAKTVGRLSREAIAERAKDPINRSRDRSAQGMPLEMLGQDVELRLGPNSYGNPRAAGSFDAVVLADRSILSADWSDGWLKLSMELTDLAGQPQITIDEGELRVFTSVWDYELVGSRVVIRTGPHRVAVEIELNPNGLYCSRGTFVHAGKAAVITPQSLDIGYIVKNVPSGENEFRRALQMGGNRMYGVKTGVQF